jgi:four helix bundle protein
MLWHLSYSNKEFKKYLAIANGSSFEVRAQLLLAMEVGHLGGLEATSLIEKCEEVSRLIRALRQTIR